MKKNPSKKLSKRQKRQKRKLSSKEEQEMKLKRRLSSKKAASKWSGDTSKGSSGIFENYKPKGIAPKFNSKPLQGGSPGLGKKK